MAISSIVAVIIATVVNASPLHEAVKEGDASEVLSLIAGGADLEEIDFFAGAPLHVAATSGHLSIARILIAEGVDVDVRESGANETPLHRAAGFGRSELVSMLLSEGAAIDALDDRRKTPLHKALSGGHGATATRLIEAGADLSLVTEDGDTVLELAGETKLTGVIELLLRRGAGPSEPEDIKPLLAGADAERGLVLFRKGICSRCHKPPYGKRHLWNVVGRDIASGDSMAYSEALLSAEGIWDYENLNKLLRNPTGFFPGTSMNLTGIAGKINMESARDRADVIGYLRTQAETPWPLP